MKYKSAPLIAYFCLMPILIGLGIWQLNRAEEKRSLLSLQISQQSAETTVLSANMPDFSDAFLYKPVQAAGRYDNKHQYLLDNQVNQGRAGYFVLTPFVLQHEKKAVLVNRGWVSLGKSRSDLPDISVEDAESTIVGRINRFPNVGLKLAGAEIPDENWPALIQVVDTKMLSQQLGYPLFGFQIELDKEAKNGFIREWQLPAVMTPEKHLGYAVQWFLLAITLTVLFIKVGFKKSHD